MSVIVMTLGGQDVNSSLSSAMANVIQPSGYSMINEELLFQ